jgi:hypothetical protein
MLKTTKEEYEGPYHKYADGTVMTGGSYSEKTSEYLIPFESIIGTSKSIFDDINQGEDVKKYIVPTTYYPLKNLTIDDYKQGWFERFFVKRRNDSSSGITEVTKKSFETLAKKGSGINGSLYYGISLRWKIGGNEETIVEKGITIYGIEETNKRTLFLKESKMPGITKFLGDLQEFSIYSKLTDSDIKQELL